jgi:hypothetical protein
MAADGGKSQIKQMVKGASAGPVWGVAVTATWSFGRRGTVAKAPRHHACRRPDCITAAIIGGLKREGVALLSNVAPRAELCSIFLGGVQVNFILQEAHEKANEIMVKTEHDFK